VLSEAYLVCRTLFVLPYRLVSLPPLYLRLGVLDPYSHRELLPLPASRAVEMAGSGTNSASRSTEEDSGNPSVSADVPSETPSDQQSGGVVPGRAARGQRYMVVSESSESSDSDDAPESAREPEASVSGRTAPEFSCRGVFSTLRDEDLPLFRERFGITEVYSLAVPRAPIDACTHVPGFTTVFEDTFLAGLRLPLHPVARDLLIFLGIAPGQLAPNGWRFLMGAIYFWPQYFGFELTLAEFLWVYRPFGLAGDPGFFSLSARPGKKIIVKAPSNNKGWKNKFFHVSVMGFSQGELRSGDLIPESWATELSGKARVSF